MKVQFHDTAVFDVVVVGGGLAAIKTVYECAKEGLSVLMVVKRGVCSGSSFYPLTAGLGCQMPKDDADKVLFLEELLESNAGMGSSELCEIYIDEIASRVSELPEMGIDYQVILGGRKACFAERERLLASWWDKDAITQKTARVLREFPNISIMEYSDAVSLVINKGRVSGVIISDYRSHLYYMKTANVVMETGGYCGLYKHSLNTDDVCGLGHAMALDAGAKLVNLEFTQFIPGMMSPVYKMIINELSIRYCEALLDEEGKDILTKYLPENIPPQQCFESRAGHGPFTARDFSKYFDVAKKC
jgi:succinate dehydrogenase/fumarate reductase flavoprotein subunit